MTQDTQTGLWLGGGPHTHTHTDREKEMWSGGTDRRGDIADQAAKV